MRILIIKTNFNIFRLINLLTVFLNKDKTGFPYNSLHLISSTS